MHRATTAVGLAGITLASSAAVCVAVMRLGMVWVDRKTAAGYLYRDQARDRRRRIAQARRGQP